jgi:hypothetical protein
MADTKETLCWRCENYNCSWAKSLKPVEGWKAKPTVVYDAYANFNSYLVISCPEFKGNDIKSKARKVLEQALNLINRHENRCGHEAKGIILTQANYINLTNYFSIEFLEDYTGYKFYKNPHAVNKNYVIGG